MPQFHSPQIWLKKHRCLWLELFYLHASETVWDIPRILIVKYQNIRHKIVISYSQIMMKPSLANDTAIQSKTPNKNMLRHKTFNFPWMQIPSFPGYQYQVSLDANIKFLWMQYQVSLDANLKFPWMQYQVSLDAISSFPKCQYQVAWRCHISFSSLQICIQISSHKIF